MTLDVSSFQPGLPTTSLQNNLESDKQLEEKENSDFITNYDSDHGFEDFMDTSSGEACFEFCQKINLVIFKQKA